MKYLILSFSAIMLWSACSHKVQVVTVKSDVLQQDTLLRYSNDTFEIVYNLYADGGLMSFSIYNKSNVPLYVDWKRSALIHGMQKQDYYAGEVKVKTQSNGYSIDWLNWYSTNRNYTTGLMVQEEQITFIPPRTAITKSKFRISGQLSVKDFTELKVPKTYKKGTTTIFTKEFNQENSPLHFRNFLTLSLKHDFSSEFYVDHNFWAGSIINMSQQQFEGRLFIVKVDKFTQYNEFEYPYRKPNNLFIDGVE